MAAANLRFVINYAQRYAHLGLPLGELISEGNVGLMIATEEFKPDRGVKFLTYAVWWIRAAIVKELSNTGPGLRLPAKKKALLIKLLSARRTLFGDLGREPTHDEVIEYLGVKQNVYYLSNKVPIKLIKRRVRQFAIERNSSEEINN